MPMTLNHWDICRPAQPICILLEYTGEEHEDKYYALFLCLSCRETWAPQTHTTMSASCVCFIYSAVSVQSSFPVTPCCLRAGHCGTDPDSSLPQVLVSY
uniref:GST N-terminal domain-containing protein n=1 Tax=Maylandia zebra TaxID=106582 RepID=A0A3P9DQ88_9CICH